MRQHVRRRKPPVAVLVEAFEQDLGFAPFDQLRRELFHGRARVSALNLEFRRMLSDGVVQQVVPEATGRWCGLIDKKFGADILRPHMSVAKRLWNVLQNAGDCFGIWFELGLRRAHRG